MFDRLNGFSAFFCRSEKPQPGLKSVVDGTYELGSENEYS